MIKKDPSIFLSFLILFFRLNKIDIPIFSSSPYFSSRGPATEALARFPRTDIEL